jgi:hypothetical protein
VFSSTSSFPAQTKRQVERLSRFISPAEEECAVARSTLGVTDGPHVFVSDDAANVRVHLRLRPRLHRDLHAVHGNPAVLGNESVRPVALRPRLSASLPLARRDLREHRLISQAGRSLSGDTVDGDERRARRLLSLCRKRATCAPGSVKCLTFGSEQPGFRNHTAMRVQASLFALAGSPAMMRGASWETIWTCAASDRPSAFKALSRPSMS